MGEQIDVQLNTGVFDDVGRQKVDKMVTKSRRMGDKR